MRRRAGRLPPIGTHLEPRSIDHIDEGSISISGRRRLSLGAYRFSKREPFPRKYLFTQASNPHNERYEDYPLLILEEGPRPPNDDEIAKPYLQRINTGSDGDSLILTGRYAAHKATRIIIHVPSPITPDSGESISELRGSWKSKMLIAT